MGIRVTVLVAAFVAASSAHAGWSVLGESEDYTLYLDPGSLRRDGDTLRIWVLQDFKTPSRGSGARSYRLLEQVDCKKGRVRILSSSLHAGAKATGEVLKAETMQDEAWRPAEPGTPAAYVLEEICGIRGK